jgi:hypothetical protein
MCHVISDHKTRVVKTLHELKNFCKTQKVFKIKTRLLGTFQIKEIIPINLDNQPS